MQMQDSYDKISPSGLISEFLQNSGCAEIMTKRFEDSNKLKKEEEQYGYQDRKY